MEPICAADRRGGLLPRAALHRTPLLALYAWSEDEFLFQTEGSPIRRIGYFRWLRNITVALGNAPYQEENVTALNARKGLFPLLDEHIDWALERQIAQQKGQLIDLKEPKRQRLIRSIEKGLPRDA